MRPEMNADTFKMSHDLLKESQSVGGFKREFDGFGFERVPNALRACNLCPLWSCNRSAARHEFDQRPM